VLHMAIARFPGIVIDCPDPAALATFLDPAGHPFCLCVD